ncbi:MAG TPA: tetratricopeptide repeat protein [Candidatus Obscuribacterales bacterium]
MNPQKNVTEFNLGKQFLAEGKLEEAITAFRLSIALMPNDSWPYYYLGEALIKKGLVDEAVIAFRRAIELNPNFSWSYHQLGEALSQQNNWTEAIAAYRQAIQISPDHYGTYVLLGKGLIKLGQLDEAITAYRQAIQLSPNEDWLYLDLADLVEKRIKSDLAEVSASYQRVRELNPDYLPVYHKIIQMQPNEANVWLEFAETLVKHNQIEEAISAYRRAWELNSEYVLSQYQLENSFLSQGLDRLTDYHRLGLLLAEQGLFKEAVTCFQQAPNSPMGEDRIYDNIWKGLNGMGLLNEEDSYYPEDINPAVAHTYFHHHSQYTVIHLSNLTDADQYLLNQEGFLVSNLNLINQDNWALEEIYINSFSQEETIQLAKKEAKKLNYVAQPFLNTPNEFQKSIVQTGYIYAVCPISGKVIRSEQSFYDAGGFPPMLCYRFVGAEVFYLIVGHYWGAKMFLYFPRIELIVMLSPHIAPQPIVNRLKANIVSCWPEVSQYISSSEKKKVVALSGLNPNIGHTLWNEVTGLHYLHENGILEKLDKVVAARYDYFKVGNIFDELTDKVLNIFDDWSLFKTILAHNYFGVMATNVFIKEDLVEKMYETSLQKCSPILIQEIEQAKQHFPLVWIGIRTHSRVWLSLVEGSANIIKKLHSEFPNLGVVFDGWSRMETEDPNAESMIAREQAVLADVLALIPPSIKIYNLIGAKTYEKIVWAHAVDLYLSTPGSSTTFVLWIANKKGVVHANRVHYATWVDEQLLSRDNANLPVYIPLNSINDQPTSPEMAALNLQNYDFDWQIAYGELVKIIKEQIENNC